MRKLLLITSILSLLVACRGSDGKETDDNVEPTPGADARPGSAMTVYDVQSDSTPAGTSVNLRSVVVTAIDNFGGRTGGIFVQEADGGPYSGVFVFVPGSVSASLAVNDVVDVTGGVKDEFALQADTTGRSLTEVSPPEGGSISVTKVGTGNIVPEAVSAWDLATDDAEAEKWEGVLITVSTVRALGGAYSVSKTDDTLKELEISGPYRVGGSLTLLSEDINRGDCFTSITGVGDYFFNYKILPRSGADIVAGEDGDCLPEEDTAELCGDEIDNDQDGFTDCDDRSCQDSVAACTTEVTVVAAQTEVEVNSRIRLSGVRVTAVAAGGASFWVQDAGDAPAAAYNGLYVFRPGLEVDEQPMTVGSTVSVSGNFVWYQGEVSELTNVDLEVSSSGDATSVKVLDGVPFADLFTPNYEGVLVSVPNATVVDGSDGQCDEFCTFTVGTTGDVLYVGDDIYRHTATVGTCYGTFVGVMHYDTYNDRVVILPREGDLVAGCQ